MNVLTPERRRFLKARAHHLNPVVIIGDAGLTPAMIREIDVHLRSHELIKIRVLGDDREARTEYVTRICEALDAFPVQHIGKILVIYRQRPDDAPGGRHRPSAATPRPAAAKGKRSKAPRRTKRSYQSS